MLQSNRVIGGRLYTVGPINPAAALGRHPKLLLEIVAPNPAADGLI